MMLADAPRRFLTDQELPQTTIVRVEAAGYSKWSGLIRELNSLHELGPNWDGYGAPAVEPVAIIAAAKFVAASPFWVSAPSVVPTSQGGVQLEWHQADLNVEVAFVLDRDPEIYVEDQRLAAGGERELPASEGGRELFRRVVLRLFDPLSVGRLFSAA